MTPVGVDVGAATEMSPAKAPPKGTTNVSVDEGVPPPEPVNCGATLVKLNVRVVLLPVLSTNAKPADVLDGVAVVSVPPPLAVTVTETERAVVAPGLLLVNVAFTVRLPLFGALFAPETPLVVMIGAAEAATAGALVTATMTGTAQAAVVPARTTVLRVVPVSFVSMFPA